MSPQGRLTLILVAALAFTAWAAVAAGPLFVAPSGDDANDCLSFATACQSIGAAVGKASSDDTIIIASGMYTESVTLDKNLTLIGFGADATIINGGRIVVSSATVRIYDLGITNGYDGNSGGALYNDKGVVLLSRVSILNSHAYDGGGIFNRMGTLTLANTVVAGNTAVQDGGGIYNDGGNVSLSHSTIVSNSACNTGCLYVANHNSPGKKPVNGFLSLGGGILNFAGSLTIDTSAIISNSATSDGDSIYNGGPLVITNSTISNNTGSAYDLENDSIVTLTNVTMNGSVINLRSSFGPARAFLRNTIIANSGNGSDCTGSNIVSLGHNLSSDSTCNLTASGDLTNTDPQLGPLQDNGGPTPTHALLAGSPAINHGDNAGCPPTDQRGITRPQAGLCDIGAFEYVFPITLIMPIIRR